MIDTERLGDEIATLAADIHAATCRLMDLIVAFDLASGWFHEGAKSCAHWLSWRCGFSERTARDHVRVAHRLQELPLVKAAFGRGELSYSKVRALTRLSAITEEAQLLEFARAASAAQLDKAVRTYRACEAVDADAVEAHARRFLDFAEEDDGTVRISGRLPADEAALVIAALEDLRETLDARRKLEADYDDAAPWESRGARRADALLMIIEDRAAHERTRSTGGDRCQVVLHVEPAALIAAEPGDGAPRPRAETADGLPVPRETVRRLCCDAGLVPVLESDGKQLDVGRRTRTIPPAIRRALRARDHGCQFPGCNETRHIEAHHIDHWADGGETKLTNLSSFCRYHHRFLHEYGYTVRWRGGRLCVHGPNGKGLRAVPRHRGECARVLQENRRAGVRPDALTTAPTDGGRMDLGLAVDAVDRYVRGRVRRSGPASPPASGAPGG